MIAGRVAVPVVVAVGSRTDRTQSTYCCYSSMGFAVPVVGTVVRSTVGSIWRIGLVVASIVVGTSSVLGFGHRLIHQKGH